MQRLVSSVRKDIRRPPRRRERVRGQLSAKQGTFVESSYCCTSTICSRVRIKFAVDKGYKYKHIHTHTYIYGYIYIYGNVPKTLDPDNTSASKGKQSGTWCLPLFLPVCHTADNLYQCLMCGTVDIGCWGPQQTMSAVSHSRQCLLRDTLDIFCCLAQTQMTAVTHTNNVCFVTQQIFSAV